MGGCENYGPFLDPVYSTAPNIQGTHKGTIILTTTHMRIMEKKLETTILDYIGLTVLSFCGSQLNSRRGAHVGTDNFAFGT